MIFVSSAHAWLDVCNLQTSGKWHSHPQSPSFFSWSSGLETRGSGSSHYQIPVNCGHQVTHVQKSQISLLMLIMDFCPSPLDWGKHFTSWALSREWLLWAVLKHVQTSLNYIRFIDNLESKGYDINKNQLNTLLGCKTETVNRRDYCLSLKMWVHVWWKQTLGKQDRGDRRYLVPCPANAISDTVKPVLIN